MFKFLKRNILYIALIQAVIATLGSLYYSEVRQFTPCILCWYQRIFMFPISITIPVGILRKDKGIYQYVLPLSIIGAVIAFYQVLLQKGILPEAITPCTIGASCTTEYVNYLGFISIPDMSFTAFVVIILCMLFYRRFVSK